MAVVAPLYVCSWHKIGNKLAQQEFDNKVKIPFANYHSVILKNMSFNHNLVSRIQQKLLNFGSVLVALFIFAIYFSTSLAVIMSGVLGALWLLTGQFKHLPDILKRCPVAAWALALFVCFIVGLSYGSATTGEAVSMVMKYRELFFIAVLFSFLTNERDVNWAWKAFVIASVITLLASYLMDIDIISTNKQGDPSIKSRITHGIFIAFFVFYCLHKVSDGGPYSRFYLIGVIMSLYNIFFIVEGRTGQLIALALILLFAIQRFGNKGRILTLFAVTAFLVLFLSFSDKANRINEGFANTQAFLQPKPEQTESSMGQRYTFWKYSLKLIAEKPLLGHGTGSFAKEYQRIAMGEQFITVNPHNEFVMVGVQLGLLGVLVYLGFLASQFYYARKLPANDKWLAQGLLVLLAITSLFNTPFFDHAEGHWYACMIALCFVTLGSGNKILINDA